jgi:hypothetical protein
MNQAETELKKLIQDSLDNVNPTILPRLAAYISSAEGRESAEIQVFNICASQGVSIQTALSLLDSELP